MASHGSFAQLGRAMTRAVRIDMPQQQQPEAGPPTQICRELDRPDRRSAALHALDADRMLIGALNCYVAGDGPPLLLVHGVSATASAADVRPVFERFKATHTVFALDLPGFGLSDRSQRDHTPQRMTDAIHTVTDQIRRRCGRQPVDALAVSLGCEFVARAAVEHPADFAHLAFVSPTGLDGTRERFDPRGSTREIPWLRSLITHPLLAGGLYRLLTQPAVVRLGLQRTWGSAHIDETLCAHAVNTARAPDAAHAPLDHLSGRLFSADIHRIYKSLTQPVWLSRGVRGNATDVRALRWLGPAHPWRQTIFATGGMPFFEMQEAFAAELADFLGDRNQGSLSLDRQAALFPRFTAAWGLHADEQVGALQPPPPARPLH